MQHRGAILADGKTGDGCGLLLQKPDRFFRIVAQERGWRLAKNYAVGMLFLNKDPELAAAARRIVEEELQRETLSIVGWRDVPTNEGVLGEIALSSLPRIEQIFVNAPAGFQGHSRVADLASQWFYEQLGEGGICPRTAVGVSSLPGDAPVELQTIFLCG